MIFGNKNLQAQLKKLHYKIECGFFLLGNNLELQQLCYMSRATSVQPHILQDLRDILSEARSFNFKHQINGVLYFSNGYFFQFLEGSKNKIDLLLLKLKKDQRHQDYVFYDDFKFETGQFKDWSMKYIGRNSSVNDYLLNQGFQSFEPFDLNQEQRLELLVMLSKAQNEA